LFLKGDGQGHFQPLSIWQSGIFIPGNGKSLVKLRSAGGDCLVAAAQNRGELKIFLLKRKCKTLVLQPLETRAEILYKNGKTGVQEFYYGSSFLSESGRFLLLSDSVSSVTVINNIGRKRKIVL